MKIKTNELTGSVLDWAVAKAAGLLEPRDYYGKMVPSVVLDMEYWSDGTPFVRLNPCPDVYYTADYTPSTDWAQGGPIIEREKISLEFLAGAGDAGADVWVAARTEGLAIFEMEGWTPLRAAMRCYVASKLGDEVEIPNELI